MMNCNISLYSWIHYSLFIIKKKSKISTVRSYFSRKIMVSFLKINTLVIKTMRNFMTNNETHSTIIEVSSKEVKNIWLWGPNMVHYIDDNIFIVQRSFLRTCIHMKLLYNFHFDLNALNFEIWHHKVKVVLRTVF